MSTSKRLKEERDGRRRSRHPSPTPPAGGTAIEPDTVVVSEERWSALVNMHQDLAALLSRDDGYLRICPENAGENCYWRWKWTRGAHRGCYVMAVVGVWCLPYGAETILRKVGEVETGQRRPTPDRAYRPPFEELDPGEADS